MHITGQIVGVLVGMVLVLVGGLVTVAPLLKRQLFPASIVDELTDPATAVTVRTAEAVVRRAVRTVSWPFSAVVVVTTFVALRIADHSARPALAIPVVVIGFAASLAWRAFAIRRWWQWALQQDADLLLVDELAEDARLVWGQHTWFGRRQRLSWMRLPPEAEERDLVVAADRGWEIVAGSIT